MMKIFLFLWMLIFSLEIVDAQEVKKSNWIIGPSVGYQHQKHDFLKVSAWGLTDLGYANYLKFDAGTNFTWKEGKTYVVPEMGVSYYLTAKAIWPFVKAEVNALSVSPKVGIGIFNILELGLGYGFSLKNHKVLGDSKGTNFSIAINVPLNYHLY